VILAFYDKSMTLGLAQPTAVWFMSSNFIAKGGQPGEAQAELDRGCLNARWSHLAHALQRLVAFGTLTTPNDRSVPDCDRSLTDYHEPSVTND